MNMSARVDEVPTQQLFAAIYNQMWDALLRPLWGPFSSKVGYY